MELRIQTTFPQLDINYIWPRLVINQQPTQIRVETSGPKVEIDQREAWSEIGYSARPLFNKQISDLSRAAVLKGIRRYAQDGDRVVRSLGKVDMRKVTPQIVKERDREKIPELNVAAVPRTRPKVKFAYEATVDWVEGWVTIHAITQPPEITWQLGSVDIFVVGTQYDGRR